MEIAYFVRSFPTISETFILNQITGLIDRGHDVRIYANTSDRDKREHSEINEYNLRERTTYLFNEPLPPERSFYRIRAVFKLLSQGLTNPFRLSKVLHGLSDRSNCVPQFYRSQIPELVDHAYPPRHFDILHGQFGWNGLKALFLRKLGLVTGRLVTTFHSNDVDTFPEHYGHDVYEPLFDEGDLFLSESEALADRLRKLGCPDERLSIHRLGIDLEKFTPSETSSDDSLQILSVARLVPFKGLKFGIKALAKLDPDIDFTYKIIGKGPEKSRLKKLTAELDLSDRIRFLGEKPHRAVRNEMNSSDVFLAPSIIDAEGQQDNTMTSVLEAQAMKLPVVATMLAGLKEAVDDGNSGFLVPQKDPDALADKLDRLLRDSKLRERFGQAGREFIQTRYNLTSLNDTLEEKFETLLTGSSN